MKKILIAAACFLGVLAISVPAYASTPLVSWSRLNIGVGVDKDLTVDGDAGWRAIVAPSYSLLGPDPSNPDDRRPKISLPIRVEIPLDKESKGAVWVGLRWTIKSAGR